MPRGKTQNRRVSFFLEPDAYELVLRMARLYMMSPSDWTRMKLLQELGLIQEADEKRIRDEAAAARAARDRAVAEQAKKDKSSLDKMLQETLTKPPPDYKPGALCPHGYPGNEQAEDGSWFSSMCKICVDEFNAASKS